MIIKYKGGYKYQLVSTATFATRIYPSEDIDTRFILLNKSGVLTIRAGYAWDGPSGPTFDTKSFMRGSLAHDALYQLLRQRLLDVFDGRRKADELLREICLKDGMWRVRAWWVYRAVRVGARQSSLPSHIKKVQTAP